MEIRKIPISQINPAAYNPRLDLKPGDPEYEKLKRSIDEFGYVEPCVWNERTGNLVGGHQRFKILLEKGEQEVLCSVVDLDDDREKALNIALNKISGDWDLPKLKDLLEELDTGNIDIELTGFTEDEITDLMTQFHVEEETDEDDFDPEAEASEIKEPITKRGDVWVLGRHRLMCGDATFITDVEKLMDGAEADMVFTDPPYNVNYEGGTGLKIQNDDMADDEFKQFLIDSFASMFAATKPGGGIYICHADSEGINFRTAMVEAGWLMKQCIIWVKDSLVLGRQDYQWRHEPILYGWKPGAKHRWFGGRKQTTVIESDNVLTVKPEADGSVLLTVTVGVQSVVLRVPKYEVVYAGNDEHTSIWRFEKPSRNPDHPTMKPIGIPARAIQNSSRPGDIVLDLFGGSGSTLIAAEQTGRSGYLMELDPVYCDVIVRRWEKLTGQKGVLLVGQTD
ncbi:site-specific DNA-methyltransferase [Paenibacillus naphthalenovorans]|uniref:site-specific DNA-methyltransferase n=1 Tax=Paenibacillus naphthalenovorans TaxID=162209 RepID=UPI003D29CC08